MSEPYPTLHLRSGREYTIRRGHPWVFSGAFRELPQDIPPGSVADVVSSSGEWIARGHVNVRNSLAFRVLTLDPDDATDTSFYARRIARALDLRALLPASVNAYRLVNAEADYLPGVIVDRYDRWLSVQLHTAGADRDRPQILAALEQIVRPDGILARDDIKAREREGLPLGGATLAAGTVPETLTIIEHDVYYLVDPWHGQKTGFFLDQRDKRALIGDVTQHAHTLLNTFSYSGGFALAALARNPALHTVNVDSSDAALDLARRNYALNGHVPAAHEFIASDVNRFLQQCAHEGRVFDVVIVDPPAFAKNLSMKDRALRGYETLNAHAARVVAPNGLLLACSCSGGVNAADFENAVQQGVFRAARSAQLLATFGPSVDHPTLPGFVEDRYLKALLLRLS